MRFATRSALIATAYLALQGNALPRPATPSYSVVAVDGGQDSDPVPTTIVQTVTDSQSQPTTVTIEDPPTPTTATTTLHDTQLAPTPSPNTVTLKPEASVLTAPTVVIPGSRTSYTTTAVSSYTTTVSDVDHTTVYEEASTTTIVSMVTPSTSYFDDGMWHTSYGVPVWPTKGAMHNKQYNRNQTSPSTTQPWQTGAWSRHE